MIDSLPKIPKNYFTLLSFFCQHNSENLFRFFLRDTIKSDKIIWSVDINHPCP